VSARRGGRTRVFAVHATRPSVQRNGRDSQVGSKEQRTKGVDTPAVDFDCLRDRSAGTDLAATPSSEAKSRGIQNDTFEHQRAEK